MTRHGRILSEVDTVAHILGRKVGMTRVFGKDGESISVTIIEAGPCVVVQKKTVAKEGYDAIQVGFFEKKVKAKRNNDGTRRRNMWPGKPTAGHFAKAGTPAFAHLREFRVEKVDDYKVGQELTVAGFKAGEKVDVIGTSKGKGFAGVMRRHGFSGGADTHGSMTHRAPGSIGTSADPSRVFPGIRMGGHMGDARVTVRNLEVVEVDAENNLILVRGPAPGAKRALVMVQPTHFRSRSQQGKG
jgi:large subunit ribosomal protein L3